MESNSILQSLPPNSFQVSLSNWVKYTALKYSFTLLTGVVLEATTGRSIQEGPTGNEMAPPHYSLVLVHPLPFQWGLYEVLCQSGVLKLPSQRTLTIICTTQKPLLGSGGLHVDESCGGRYLS